MGINSIEKLWKYNMEYTFNSFNAYSVNGLSQALHKNNIKCKKPIIVCVGSDLVLGDSLGPLVGTLLKKKNLSSYVYGTLNSPITAREVGYVKTYVKKMHPNSIVIAIDAAIGSEDDIGLIKLKDKGLKPGLGVNKDLDIIGDISIIGIVAGKSENNYSLYNLTRLNLVYKMADVISESLNDYLYAFDEKIKSAL